MNSAMDCVTPAQIDLDSPEGWNLSLDIRDKNALSGKALESPRLPMVGEAMRPLQQCMQLVLGGTQGQPSRGNTGKEKRCPPSVAEQGAHSSECRELDMCIAFDPYHPPTPHELSTVSLGGPPDNDNSPTLDPAGTQGSTVLFETNN